MGVTKCDACKEECICRVCARNDRCEYAIRKDCRKCLECQKCESGFGDISRRIRETLLSGAAGQETASSKGRS